MVGSLNPLYNLSHCILTKLYLIGQIESFASLWETSGISQTIQISIYTLKDFQNLEPPPQDPKLPRYSTCSPT
jgi:hypothetical protein